MLSSHEKKTKKMIIGSPLREQQLSQALQVVTQVSVFMLLGVTINNSLRWSDHTESVVTSKRLWFLKKLKQAGMSHKDIVYYYEAVVRPVLEYASPVWHTSLTVNQTKTQLKQFSDELVGLLRVAIHIQKTVYYYG